MYNLVKRFITYAPVRTLFATVVFLILILPINKLVLEPVLGFLPFSEDTLRSIRFLIMIPLAIIVYTRIFGWIEKRKVTEWGTETFWKEIGLGFMGGFFAIGLTLILLLPFGQYHLLGFYSEASVIAIVQGFIFIAMLALAEEIIFRGVLYRAVEKSLGTLVALAVTGLVFGLLHVSNDNSSLTSTLAITLGGALMGCLFTLTSRLWVPVMAHIGWNFYQVIFGVRLSGQDEFLPYSLFESGFGENALLTGGEFGPENSIITILTTGILLIFLIRHLTRNNLIHQASWKRDQGGPHEK